MGSHSGRLGKRASKLVSPPPTENHVPPPATGRAGRNLPWAIAIGVGLLTLVGVFIFLPQPFLIGLIAVAVAVALWELAGAFGRANVSLTLPPLWVGAAGILVCAWQVGVEAMTVALFLTMLACAFWRIMDGGGLTALRDVLVSSFAAMYVPFLAGFAVLMHVHGGPWPVVIFLLGTISNDLGGYITGVLFGKHPLAPSVSPAKSWEGFIGSVAMSAAVVAVGMHLLGIAWWVGIVTGVVSAMLATIGDLGESLIKRDIGLKDMSNLLPGHGGIMDRLDSLLVTMPLYYVVFLLALRW